MLLHCFKSFHKSTDAFVKFWHIYGQIGDINSKTGLGLIFLLDKRKEREHRENPEKI